MVCILYKNDDVNEILENVEPDLYKSQNTQHVTKLLDNGRDATAFTTGNKAYLAATDGIYIYDYIKGTTKKYGSH